ncbi:MAG: ROK family protein [Candidatus Omnitrophica bacterium]|nr:ROK family protein [Candidatus Omnitrophota bacterium]MBU1127465.1 ROK family protein [Candidatus Omnitrophota bacterium]MBU1785061.1 ROK family protein [Candidatus Omnitrophota bacterium]MBU1851689.1 ROK family protein [Candidatus Omnitrophota bacterium]
MSAPNLIIGVDIGGTKIAAGLISDNGDLKRSVVVPTLAEGGFKVSLKQVFAAIGGILSMDGINRRSVKGIGICAPGPLDPTRGIVFNPPNLPGWKNIDIVSRVKRKFKIDARLENDANAAAMAEMVWGAARGHKDIFYVTVSTGIGTGIIINEKIYHGKNGMAGEGGHMTINYDDKSAVCGCGQIGCVEALASGTYTENRLKEKLKRSPRRKTILRSMTGGDIDKITMRVIARAARKKDEFATQTIKEQGELLGVWVGGMISLLDPEIIVIGGGVSMIGELIFREIRKSAYCHTINIFAKKTPIVRAKLKKDSGIFGAASIFMRK